MPRLGPFVFALSFPSAAFASADCRPFLTDTLNLAPEAAERLVASPDHAQPLNAIIRLHGKLNLDRAAHVAEALVRRPTLTDQDRALIRANPYYRAQLSSLGEDDQLNYVSIHSVLKDHLSDFDIAILATTLGGFSRAARAAFRDQVEAPADDKSLVHLGEVLRRDEYRVTLLELLTRGVPLPTVVQNVRRIQNAVYGSDLRIGFDERTARAILEQIRQRRLDPEASLFTPLMIEAAIMEIIAFGRERAGLPKHASSLTEPETLRTYAKDFLETRWTPRARPGVVLALIGVFGGFDPLPVPAEEVIARFRAGARALLEK